MEEQSRKKHVVLVHGLCHGAWCWYKVATLLRSAGHRITTPDLAASGIDRRLLEQVPTFAEYTQPLLDVLRSLPPGERVVLVGHSLGGINIAMAMDQFPEKIAVAVFLTAFLPDSSNNPAYVNNVINKDIKDVPMSYWLDTDFGQVKQPPSVLFGPQFLAKNLYQLSPPEDLMLANTLVRPGSMYLDDLSSLPPFSKSGYGSVATVFVVCCQDLAISVESQRWMLENYPRVNEVKELKGADHMAMLSVPQELCECLKDIAATYD